MCYTLYLGVSLSVYQSSWSLAVQPRLEVIPINCIGNIVAIMLYSYFAVRVLNSLPADSVDFFYLFVAFKRTVQQIDFTSFLSC